MASRTVDFNGPGKQPELMSVTHISTEEADSIQQKIKNKPRDAIHVRPRPTVEQARASRQVQPRPSKQVNPSKPMYWDARSGCKPMLAEQPRATQHEQSKHHSKVKARSKPSEQVSTCAKGQPRLPKAKSRAGYLDQDQDQAKPKSLAHVQSTPKSTSIRITFTEKKEKSNVQMFLCNHLTALVDDIEKSTIEDSESTTSVVVYFPSMRKATKALEELNCREEEYSVQMMAATDADVEVIHSHIPSAIKSFQEDVELKRKHYLEHHDRDIDDLRASLASLHSKKKFRLLEEHERVSKERAVLNSKLEERQQQRKEFEDYVNDQLSILLSLTALDEESLQAKLKSLTIHLSREYIRFSAALPIYARRSEIIETIRSHQVTVLVGETGSGKSTQVVQYLYEAGIAEHGHIVCTQPRKVAAITLAKHVSQEMKIELGKELGYRVGMSIKCSGVTKIFYMTDHALLNECITDCALSKYSCVLVDEAHERSINTDMLLAFIKQCLPSRRDLKVVIMSATIEPELFVRYFQEGATSEQERCGTRTRVSTIMVSGRTFPVEVEYDPLKSKIPLSPESNYVMNAIEIAQRIHSHEPPGGILVFLTCAPEIERACRAMEHLGDNVVVLPLHGKLPPDEQQKVFVEYSRKRKIIFSTNVAETSVTIPGVKYVVDTGLAKEMQLDPKKNMDSLEVRMISKSSAEQRKGRAGRVSAGKCYRLYSSEVYDSSMPERTKPEILRIQLSQVVLKLFEFGVPNVLTFNFVEHPDRAALEAAVKTLKFVGAIQDGTLTDVGKKMAALPLNPQLAKVLLDGLNTGLGTEVLISVAISSLAGQVFFRGGTDEMKLESDKMKLTFCHPMGDQMTSLSAYQCWQQQEKEDRTKWCVEKYINARSMRIVEETVKELGHILKQRLKVNVCLKLESLEAADCYLGKLYFDAFLNNLAVYLGHEQAGYLTTNETNSTYVIFPGSSLKQLSSTPKYVIYERTLKTSRQFLTQVMCVKQEWVDEAVKMGQLSEDPAEKFKDHMLKPLHVIAIGPQTYREMAKKQNEILEVIKVNVPQCTISPVMDFSTTPKQWGVVCALAQQKYHNAVKLVVTQCVREKQAEFIEEKKEFGIMKERDSTQVVIGSGGTVQQVIMPFQFRTVVAVSSSEGEWVDQLQRQMEKYGKVEKTQSKKCHNDFRLFVTYTTTVAAQRAMSESKYPNVTLRPWHGQQFTLKIQWERRQRGTFAFISFDNPIHCENAQRRLGSYIRGRVIKVAPDKWSKSKLFLSGRELRYIDEDNLRARLAYCIGEDTNFHLKMGYQKYVEQQIVNETEYDNEEYYNESDSTDDKLEYEHVNEEDGDYENSHQAYMYHDYLEKCLMELTAKYARPGTYSLKFINPKEQAIFFRAYITFDDPDEGYRVLNSELKHEDINGKLLTVSPDLKSMLFFKREIFVLIREHLESEQRKLLQNYCKVLRIHIIPPDKDFARISIFSDDVKAFAVAQNKLNLAAQPHVLECKTTELQEYILSPTCREELEEIQGSTLTYICRDINTMCIKIYGAKENQTTATTLVRKKANQLFSGGATVFEVSLGGSGHPPGLMKCLVTRYGCDLEGMLDIEGVRRIGLNPCRQLISLLATAEGLDTVNACIEALSKTSQATIRKMEGEYKVDCSACFTQVEETKDLIRLECCGHAFHTDCIAMQVKADTLTFPVLCAREGCSREFLLRDFKNLQERLKFRMTDLVSAALQNYMERHRDTYKNCPTPDCKMIYTVSEDGKTFICSNCTVSTCTKCHEQYHAGISCDVYKRSNKTDEEIQEWIKVDPENRKKCPKCCSPIEKDGGCMHMACICGTHICWLCLKYCKTARECYDHLPMCPAQPTRNLPAPPPVNNHPPANNPAWHPPPPARPILPVNRHIPPANNPARHLPPVINPARPTLPVNRHIPPANNRPRARQSESSCSIL